MTGEGEATKVEDLIPKAPLIEETVARDEVKMTEDQAMTPGDKTETDQPEMTTSGTYPFPSLVAYCKLDVKETLRETIDRAIEAIEGMMAVMKGEAGMGELIGMTETEETIEIIRTEEIIVSKEVSEIIEEAEMRRENQSLENLGIK